ncbi:MAG: phosphate ABC transporter permease subunit PstC [Anaerolineae bacterium]|jgi:phosphate ABC transporter permease protein PstC
MRKEKAIQYTLLALALTAVLSLTIITIFILREGVPVLLDFGIVRFLTSRVWAPTQGQFGILGMIVGTLWVTGGALVVGVPLGLAVAIFVTDYAPPVLADILRPAIQLLAGIPSVIYGFIGLKILVPVIRQYLGGPGLSVLAGALVLGVMILPSVIAVSEDAIRAVPRLYRDGALALGATHWQSLWRVVLPAARSGIVAGVVLGMGRAVGETMAVIMVIGNSLQLPTSLLDPATTLTSNIGLEMAYASGAHRQALFATGVVLFLFIMLLNLGATFFRRRTIRA